MVAAGFLLRLLVCSQGSSLSGTPMFILTAAVLFLLVQVALAIAGAPLHPVVMHVTFAVIAVFAGGLLCKSKNL